MKVHCVAATVLSSKNLAYLESTKVTVEVDDSIHLSQAISEAVGDCADNVLIRTTMGVTGFSFVVTFEE